LTEWGIYLKNLEMMEVNKMTLVAPINHYQYDHYAERVIAKDYDPFLFRPISKITLKSKFQQHLEEKDWEEPVEATMAHQSGLNTVNRVTVASRRYFFDEVEPTEEVLSEVTGKGMHFNEYA
jgi:hypothetical protein